MGLRPRGSSARIRACVAAEAAPGSVAIYSNAWLLLQVPYGVLGVSLLTALMPRLSRSAAEGRTADVVADLRLGTRLSGVVLLPVSALLTLFGTQLGVALFSLGAGSAGEGSTRLGATLAASAFGLLPYAVMMLQTRVFYALTDSRTPTLLQLVIVAVKIPLLLGQFETSDLDDFSQFARQENVALWSTLGNAKAVNTIDSSGHVAFFLDELANLRTSAFQAAIDRAADSGASPPWASAPLLRRWSWPSRSCPTGPARPL